MSARLAADHLIGSAWPLTEAAGAMDGQQSWGTSVAAPGKAPELEAQAAARVARTGELGPVPRPSLPGDGAGGARPDWHV